MQPEVLPCAVSVDALLKHHKLDSTVLYNKVIDQHLEAISRTVLTSETWIRLAPHLKVSKVQLDNILRNNEKEEMRKYAFLLKWNEIMNGEATYERLVKGLLEVEDASAATGVFQLLLRDKVKKGDLPIARLGK